jgi:hypothetical protein
MVKSRIGGQESMGIQFFRGIALLAFAAALSLTPAYSFDVIYSTAGAFTDCGTGYTCNGSTLTGPANLTIAFTGMSDDLSLPDNTPIAAEFGGFMVTGPLPKNTDTLSEDFSITISQTVPSVGSSSVLGVIAGQLKIFNSGVSITFSPSGTEVLANDPVAAGTVPAIEFMLGNVTYWVDQTTKIDAALPKSGQPTLVNGAISVASISAVPEPWTYSLMSLGIIGIAGFRAFANRRGTRPVG